MVFCFLCVAFSSFEKVKKLKIKKEELMWTVFCVLKCVEMLVCSLYTLSSTGFEMFSSHFLPWVSSRNGCSAFCHRLNKSDFHFTGISSFYLFMAVLGLCCCACASSSCSEWGLLTSWGVRVSCWGDFSCCRVQAVGARAELFHSMWGLSSLTRDWTCVPCIGRQILTSGPPGKSQSPPVFDSPPPN